MTLLRPLPRLALLVILATLASAPAAQGQEPSVERALLAADREWPGHACEGRVVVRVAETTWRADLHPEIPGDQPGYPDGEATGLQSYWTGQEWRWVRASCTITIRPGLEPYRRCRVIVHEVGHLALGGGSEAEVAAHHTDDGGVMDHGGGYTGAEGCRTVEEAHPPALLLADAKMILRERIRPRGEWRVTCRRRGDAAAECAARDEGQRRRYALTRGDDGRVRAERVRWDRTA